MNDKKKYLLLIIPSFLILGSCDLERIEDSTTGNATKFYTTFGGSGDEYAADVYANPDGTFIVAGGTTSFTGPTDQDAYLAKVDKNGVLVWENHFGTSDYDAARAVAPVSDGGFVFCGFTPDLSNSYANIFLVKVNSAGTEVWRKYYGAVDSSEVAFGIIPVGTSDFLVGYTSYYIIGSGNPTTIRFLRINANGSKVSDKLGGTAEVGITRMIKTADNSIVITGFYYETTTVAYIAKFMESGNMIWDQVFPEIGVNYSPSHSVVEMADNSLVLAGSDLGSSDHDFMLVSYTGIGMKLMDEIWGGANADELLGITRSQDDEIVTMGYSGSFSVNTEIYLSKRRKSDGTDIWAKHFGVIGVAGGDIELCPDGGFVMATGSTGSNVEIVLVKTDANGDYE
jgi:hypothetical protein